MGCFGVGLFRVYVAYGLVVLEFMLFSVYVVYGLCCLGSRVYVFWGLCLSRFFICGSCCGGRSWWWAVVLGDVVLGG